MFAILINYSFNDPRIDLFKTEEETQRYLENIVAEEFRIDTEENGWNAQLEWSPDRSFARIICHFADHDDVTEFHFISSVYDHFYEI